MKDRVVEVIVEKGGVIRVPPSFEEGSRVEIRLLEEMEMTQEEWADHLDRFNGTFADVDFSYLDEPRYSDPIEPLTVAQEAFRH